MARKNIIGVEDSGVDTVPAVFKSGQSVPLSDPAKSAQINRVRPSKPDMSKSVTTPGVIEANNPGAIDTSGGIGLKQFGQAAKKAVAGVAGSSSNALKRGASIIYDPAGAFARERATVASEQLNPEQTIVAAPSSTGVVDQPAPAVGATAKAVNTPAVSATPSAFNTPGIDAGAPGASNVLRPGEARYFDPRTGSNVQVDTIRMAVGGDIQQKAAWDQAGIAAAKADPARQVHFVPRGSETRDILMGGPRFNLRPRKGVEEANAVAQGAIGAINAKGGYDERIAKNATEAARANADAARVDAGLERTSKETIAKGTNEAAITVGLAKNLTYKEQLKQRMNTTAFMAQMQQLRDAAKNAVTDADKLAIQQHEDELVQAFQTSQASTQPTSGETIRITRGGKPGSINPKDFNPSTDVRL